MGQPERFDGIPSLRLSHAIAFSDSTIDLQCKLCKDDFCRVHRSGHAGITCDNKFQASETTHLLLEGCNTKVHPFLCPAGSTIESKSPMVAITSHLSRLSKSHVLHPTDTREALVAITEFATAVILSVTSIDYV